MGQNEANGNEHIRTCENTETSSERAQNLVKKKVNIRTVNKRPLYPSTNHQVLMKYRQN